MTSKGQNTFLRDSLNLPQTDFPMKAGLPVQEPLRLQTWQRQNLYQQIQDATKNRKSFILHDGPPYANGAIHLGHAINKILKDIILKSRLFSGYRAPFVPGWDCHGLPIELKVEKKSGKSGEKLSANAFRAACRAYAHKQVEQQKADFIRLGVLADWEHPYLTMDFANEANIIRALGKIIRNGHLHRGHKPVHWCFDCGSALAEAEVEYAEKTSHAVDVFFRFADPQQIFKLAGTKIHIPDVIDPGIVIWTTTPWTLPSNQAVAVHPDMIYVLVHGVFEQETKQMVLARDLAEANLHHYGITEYQILAEFSGKQLEGMVLQHPLSTDRHSSMILGDHVTTEAGTGAVHIAPDHGMEDYLVGQKYQLPMLNSVSAKGIYCADVPLFSGQHVFKAHGAIVEQLKKQQCLLRYAPLEHSYPHCWRQKTPVIFRATPQWFISMQQNGLLQQALQSITPINWRPEWGYSRIKSMLTNRPDWCISRQRTWGVPIPLLVHKQTQELHPDTLALLERVAVLVEQKGIEAWFDLQPEDLLPADQAVHYAKITDTLDVWFDSGVTHFSVLHTNKHLAFPADLYLEGSDQHRGWFQSSLLTSLAMYNQAPYKEVLTHGFTVDEQGRKMSKSLGNTVSPQQIIQQFGADILRLWVSATDFTQEMTLSDEILKRTTDTYRRIRNTARFLLANLHDFKVDEHLLPHDQLLSLDAWIIHAAGQTQKAIIENYHHYKFAAVYQHIHLFCARDLGGFYLDIIKDRQYTLPANAKARRSAQTAMYHCLQALTRWIAPILSFTAEEIWEHTGKNTSVFLDQWYDQLWPLPAHAPVSAVEWERIIAVRDLVNQQLEQLRKQRIIGASLHAEVIVYAEADLYDVLHKVGDELRFILLTSKAEARLLTEATEKKSADQMVTQMATTIEGIKLLVRPLDLPKCQRCWHLVEDVGHDPAHPDICTRCMTNISDTQGERRYYA